MFLLNTHLGDQSLEAKLSALDVQSTFWKYCAEKVNEDIDLKTCWGLYKGLCLNKNLNLGLRMIVLCMANQCNQC